MNKLIIKLFTILLFSIILTSCGEKVTFNDQITGDIKQYIGKVACDSVPMGAVLSNIKVGKITPLKGMGMTDVSIEFDYEKDGVMKHRTSALLYLGERMNGKHKLAAIGGCEYGDE